MFTWLGLIEASMVGLICITVFFLVSQLLGERYKASCKKVIWLLIALRLCIPVSLSFFPKPITVQVPVYVLGGSMGAQMQEEISQKPTDGLQPSNEGVAGKSTDNTGAAAMRRQQTSQDVLVIVWGTGCAGVLLYYLLVHFHFYHKIRNKCRECTDKELLSITAKTAEGLGLKKLPQVLFLSDARTGPFTMGFLHNTIFLPDTDYQERDLQYIIKHELAHCAGRDTQIKVLLILVNAIHWFNPAVWLMRFLVDQDMELACDERVLADASKEERREYGEVLLSRIGPDRVERPAFSTGYVHGVKFIKKRFRNIFSIQKKSGKAAGCIMVVLVAAISAAIGFETGRTVYAHSGIGIDCGIELRTDVTGDGLPDRVVVYDDSQALTTQVELNSADGREAWFFYEEDLGASSYLVCGDLSGNGAADIVLMREAFGMHLTGIPSVLHVVEEPGGFIWQEYPEGFISNPAIDMEQPAAFDDIECVGATIIEEGGQCYLRLIALDLVVLDDDTVQCIDCLLQEDGWFIKDMQTVTGYVSENRERELLENNMYYLEH